MATMIVRNCKHGTLTVLETSSQNEIEIMIEKMRIRNRKISG